MKTDILLCGAAGQETEAAARILAGCAAASGRRVSLYCDHDNGSVCAHVRLGETFTPVIPFGSADLVIGLEVGETVRALDRLSPDGRVISAVKGIVPHNDKKYDPQKMIKYLADNIGALTLIDADSICRRAGSGSSPGCVLLGAAAKLGMNGISPFELLDAVMSAYSGGLSEVNKKAYLLGAKSVSQ